MLRHPTDRMRHREAKPGRARTRGWLALVVCFWACPMMGSAEPEVRATLSHGYAQLHTMLGALAWTDDLLLFKLESDWLEDTAEDLAKTASSLDGRLERLAGKYPGVDLDDDGLPEIERRKRDAVRNDRLLSFAPMIGRTGANFERTLLLSTSGALNQMRHLCRVMLELETEPGLRGYLDDARRETDRLYARVVDLLEERYFREDG